MMYTACMAKTPASFSLDVLFRALADTTRLRLLNLIADREICVCYFVEILKTSQPKDLAASGVSAKAGIVASRREGKWMHYRLTIPKDEVASRILRETLRHLKEKPEMKRDVARLSSACCAPQKYVLLQSAPQPAILRAATQ